MNWNPFYWLGRRNPKKTDPNAGVQGAREPQIEPEKLRFRFVAQFQSQEDEDEYFRWRDESEITQHYHQLSCQSEWPRRCNITVFASQQQQEAIRNCRWYLHPWNVDTTAEVSVLVSRRERYYYKPKSFATATNNPEAGNVLKNSVPETKRWENIGHQPTLRWQAYNAVDLTPEEVKAASGFEQLEKALEFEFLPASTQGSVSSLIAVDPRTLQRTMDAKSVHKIAILDTGVGAKHLTRVTTRENFALHTYSAEEKLNIIDRHGHGAHIFGIIDAMVPPNIEIIVGKISEDGRSFEDDLDIGVAWAAENGATIICLASAPPQKLGSTWSFSATIPEGTTICIAAGNNSSECTWPESLFTKDEFHIVGSKDLLDCDAANVHEANWSSFCPKDTRLKSSHGEYVISDRATFCPGFTDSTFDGCCRGSLYQWTWRQLPLQQQCPQCPPKRDSLVLCGTSQATAFYAGLMAYGPSGEDEKHRMLTEILAKMFKYQIQQQLSFLQIRMLMYWSATFLGCLGMLLRSRIGMA